MTLAAVIPALSLLSTWATAASSAAFAATGKPGAPDGSALAAGTGNFEQMDGVFRRQQAMQLRTMEMQTEANIQKMMVDTASSIASGQLDSGNKMQNAAHKAAQGIHF